MDHGEWFSDLYRAHYAAVLRYALRRTDQETAHDVVSETFLVAWRRREAVPAGQGQQAPWLFGVARLALANAERSRNRAQRVTARLGQQQRTDRQVPDPAGAVAEQERLRQALGSLSKTDQEALRLVGWEELDLAGAALAVGCQKSVMAVRLHRARRRLERALVAADSAEHQSSGALPAPIREVSQETR
ncbi:MAG TPA: sigma-70 family RNA polymerase sigma factor [Streptosporangiaceae bacterium]